MGVSTKLARTKAMASSAGSWRPDAGPTRDGRTGAVSIPSKLTHYPGGSTYGVVQFTR